MSRRHTEVALRASRGYTKVQASGLYFPFQQPPSHPHNEHFVWATPRSSAFGRLGHIGHVTSFCGMVGITHRCHQARFTKKRAPSAERSFDSSKHFYLFDTSLIHLPSSQLAATSSSRCAVSYGLLIYASHRAAEQRSGFNQSHHHKIRAPHAHKADEEPVDAENGHEKP